MTPANQTPRIITITTPGPQGPQGPPGVASSGSNTYLGDQIITGSILISGSIIPNVGTGELTSSFSLGSPDAAWKDIYVSNGSIKFIQSGSQAVTLSAVNGGIQINSGSVISADGVSGQFITSKSLDTNITVKDYNNSLLMGPIDIETDKEIIVEEGSDLTIFGDIEIQNVTTADTALFTTSASFSDSSSYATSASFSDSSSYATSASFTTSASYASYTDSALTSSYSVSSSYTPLPYKSYIALFTCTTDNDPVVNVIENTLETTVEWVNSGPNASIKLNAADSVFTPNKTYYNLNLVGRDESTPMVSIIRNNYSEDSLQIFPYDFSGSLNFNIGDSSIDLFATIEIKVFP